MLEKLTRSTFEDCAARRFKLESEQGQIELELKEAVDVGTKPENAQRQPFAVTFEGPSEPVLPQQIYTLDNDELGSIELFLVPVASDDQGTEYEAVFT